MDRYMVVLPHTAEDCTAVLHQIEAIGAITHFDWGCKDGEHTGWVIVEAEDRDQAMMVVPTFQRKRAHLVKLTKFSPEDVLSMHG